MYAFADLQTQYVNLLGSVRITRPQVVSRGVDEIERLLESYEATSAANKIPAAWIGPTDCRESDCNPRCGIGQGDPWNQVSKHVPRGEGPFSSKADADNFYLHYDHVDALPSGMAQWTLPLGVFKWEGWNGWGPRARGFLSGYPWSCTDAYDTPAYGGHGRGGKYVADGVWDPNKLDPQPGTVALYLELIRRHPSLAIGSPIIHVPFAPPIVPAPAPVQIVRDVASLHAAMNRLLELDPAFPANDDNYDRGTYAAVRAYQIKKGLKGDDVDGIAGNQTWGLIEADLKLAA